MTDSLSPALLERYADARLPRYTSYPTAPNFSVAVGESDYRSWLRALPPASASLYVHVPFCAAMCWYCGCHTTVAAREAPVDRYMQSLRQEIGLVAGEIGRPLTASHLHFGGGTPTLMSAAQMRGIVGDLRDRFAFADDAEIAIEIDPRTLAEDMAKALGDCGFNRASLGVQSFDPVVQRAINRVQSFEETAAAVQSLRANGIERLNFDLIYGLPHQTRQSCLDTIEQALALAPDRFAVFGYAHVPSFKPHQRKIEGGALPDWESRFAQARAITEALVSAGYVEIGLDHFALPGDPLAKAAAAGRLHRNFQGYTTDQAEVLIGLGASSIGRMPQGFAQNHVRIPEYQRLVGEGHLPIQRGYRLTVDDRLRAALIERLMCDRKVDVAGICERFEADPRPLLAAAPLEFLSADGLIGVEAGMLTVKPHARPLIRTIAAAFDAHLDQGGDRYSRAV